MTVKNTLTALLFILACFTVHARHVNDFVGDTVAFVHASAMERFDEAVVTKETRLSDRLLQVSFDRAVPQTLELNHDCVENLTCPPPSRNTCNR